MTDLRKAASHRKTIAVLGAQFTRVWGSEFITGVLDAATADDVNVVCFAGGKPQLITAADGSRSYGLYDLIKPGQFDGILLSADIAHGLTNAEIADFCRSFAPTPVASFAIPAEGVITFMADSESGMRAVIRHLIEEHNYTRIAFVRGPVGQVEAEQRFQAYKAELKAHNIPFDEQFVADGDYSPESGRAAVRTLLDERSLHVQAIAASNDRMAFGVLEAFQQRGIHVPDHIAVTGFDDVSESQSMGAPLTTVHQSFYDGGRQAFAGLMKRIKGKAVADVNLLPSDLVVRWSCGCLPENIKQAIVQPKEVAHTGSLVNKRTAAIRALIGAARIPEDDPRKSVYTDVFGRAWDVFLASLRETDTSDAFLKTVQALVEVLQRNGYDFNTWQNVMSTFRRYALGGITSTTTMLHAENLFQQARMLIGELSQRAQAYRRLQFEKQEELLNHFSFSMASAMSFDAIGEAISKHFPILGLERWYVMFYGDVSSPGSVSTPPPQSYRLLLQYEQNQFDIPKEKAKLATGRLVPRGKTPEDHRYTAVVMPLSLASNRFGFMWAEMGPADWEIYVRVKNLLSSALLRTMLVQQREQAREIAEKTAAQNAKLFEAEKDRRSGAEALARSARQLSSLTTIENLYSQILNQFAQIISFEHGILFMEDVNSVAQVHAQYGLPEGIDVKECNLKVKGVDFYKTVARKGETLLIDNIDKVEGWSQPDWLPHDKSWLGVPVYSRNKVVGLAALGRAKRSFTEDEALLATTFALQATVALENARLYNEVTDMNQMMERMVSERVAELNNAYTTLEKHDKNKSAFIQVAAHELRTPLTVIKGYLGILKSDAGVQANAMLTEAVGGVTRGTNRLHQIVDSMLDVARLESQVINPHIESVNLGLILRLIHKDYVDDLAARNLTLTLDDTIKAIPPLLADPELLKKALDHIIVNAIKFTPDGGSITVDANVIEDPRRGKMAEIRVKDTGIGIDPEHHKIIFEKLYQLGQVQLHSSSRTNFKGGGAGLGLAIASGIIKALQGSIWVESEKRDEENFPGSTFFIRLPLVK